MYARSAPSDHHVPQSRPVSSPAQSDGTRSGSSGASGVHSATSATHTEVTVRSATHTEVTVRSATHTEVTVRSATHTEVNPRSSHPQQQTHVRQSLPQANVKVAPSRKKRAAPAPPPPQANRAAPPAPVVAPPPATTTTTTPAHVTPPTTLNHSRNSSHSSGFDESNVSPIESPGTTSKGDVSAKTISSVEVSPPAMVAVDRTDGQHHPQGAKQMTKSQSMPVRAAPRPVSSAGSRVSGSSSLSTLGRKKRKAPAPPPPTGGKKVSLISTSSIIITNILKSVSLFRYFSIYSYQC